MNIKRILSSNVVSNLMKFHECWIIESRYDFILQMPIWKKIMIRTGINRIGVRKSIIKGGELIPITIKAYGTE
jgi:hypothetical protein